MRDSSLKISSFLTLLTFLSAQTVFAIPADPLDPNYYRSQEIEVTEIEAESVEVFLPSETSLDFLLQNESPLKPATSEEIEISEETLTQTISAEAFLFEDETVTIEAENFFLKTQPGPKSWETDTSAADYSGSSALLVGPDTGVKYNETDLSQSPRLDYKIYIPPGEEGTYTIWVRGLATNNFNDSIHVGVDGVVQSTSDRVRVDATGDFVWSNTTMDQNDTGLAELTLGTGEQTLNVWMREDGFLFDKIQLTKKPDVPTGQGPPESAQQGDTPDITPPVITNVQYSVTDTTATITWDTDEPATSQIEYGLTSGLGFLSPQNTSLTTSHSVTLTGLESNQQYFFKTLSEDGSNNPSESAVLDFTTAAAPVISPEAFLFESGAVSIEAENFFGKTQPGSKSWETDASDPDLSGGSGLLVGPDTGVKYNETELSQSPRLDFKIYIPPGEEGTYAIWVRGLAINNFNDSIHVGVNGAVQPTSDRVRIDATGNLVWSNTTMDNNDTGLAELTLGPGEHVLNVWMREDGFLFDKIYLTKNGDTPSAQGPPESAQEGDVPDVTAPVITNVQKTVDGNSVTITWNTDEPATSQIEYGIAPGLGTLSPLDSALKTSHLVTLTGLDYEETYDFKVLSEDGNNNPSESAVQNFTTEAAPTISPEAFLFENGAVSIEAESFFANTSASGRSWNDHLGVPIHSGPGALIVEPDTGLKINEDNLASSPRLDYKIYVPPGEEGTYSIWVLGLADDIFGDSIHVGVDGAVQPTSDRVRIDATTGWVWSNTTMDNNDTGVAQLTLGSGEQTLNVWMREDGFTFDKIYLTKNGDTPTGFGPEESAQEGDTPPVDTTPPVISNIQKTVNGNSVTITWDTDEPATSQVDYGLTTSLGTLTPVDSTLKTSHSVTINDLVYDMTYYFKVHSVDGENNPSESGEQTFQTPLPPPPLQNQTLSSKEDVRKTIILGDLVDAELNLVTYTYTADQNLLDNGSFALLENQLTYIPDEGFTGSGQIQVTADHGSNQSLATIDLTIEVATINTPNDSLFDLQYHFGLLDAVRAWNLASGLGVTVAVLDTGFDFLHSDLNSSTYINTGEIAGDGIDNDENGFIDDDRGWDFVNNDNNAQDDEGHGTHVSGIIAAETDNGIGVAGVAKDAKIMALKVLDQFGGGATIDIAFQAVADAINYAVAMGAKVINMSLGYWTSAISAGIAQSIQTAITNAQAAGAVVVAAAGNDTADASLVTPVSLSGVIGVAATDDLDQIASFSNFGNDIDFSAPGDWIASTYWPSTYAWASGTSMASPIVASLAALILSQDPTATDQDVMRRLQYSSVDLGAAGYDTTFGHGRVDAFKALSYDYYADGTIKTQWLEEADENGYTRLDFDTDGKLIGGA